MIYIDTIVDAHEIAGLLSQFSIYSIEMELGISRFLYSRGALTMFSKFSATLMTSGMFMLGLWSAVAAQEALCPIMVMPVQQPLADSGPQFFRVAYDASVGLDPATDQTYQKLVGVLNGYATVPATRTVYYSAINNANDCTITGWQAIITNVTPNCNGYAVTLSIIPTLASNTFGQSALIVDSNYSEGYQVNNNGSFTFLGAQDPYNQAGQMPSIATL